ncbi:hypothetical protein AHAS_Ahas11G0213700 [Arachis hypogaea]
MFGRVRSGGGSSGEGVGIRRRSATVPVGRNEGYTSRRNRAVECRLLRTRWGAEKGGFSAEQTMEFFVG